MNKVARVLTIIFVCLLLAALPFLIWGERLERELAERVVESEDRQSIALVTFGLLASDIVLPVPSSVVATFAGARLGIAAGAATVWAGMTCGAVLGFALARWLGVAFTRRFASPTDLETLRLASRQWGVALLALTRPLPILAEATVLLMGTAEMRWPQFLMAVSLSNLGIAVVYSLAGTIAQSRGQLLLALAASIALPLVATAAARILIRRLAAEAEQDGAGQ